MNQHDESEFAGLCGLMSEVFKTPASTALIGIYFRALKDLSIEQVTAAVEQAIATKKFFPKPAELRDLIEGGADNRASQAWAMFLEAAGSGGHASIQFSDRAMASAMEAVFGGWTQACGMLSATCSDEMTAHYQKAFLRQYGAALSSRRDIPLYRPGLSEVSMREQGGTWAGRMVTLEQPVLFVGPDRVIELQLRFDVARGQLMDESRKVLEGGFDAARALVEGQSLRLRQTQERNALPPIGGEEVAMPEGLQARIDALAKR